MGSITRQYTFVSGAVPTADNWNADWDQILTLNNGQLDKANVDSSSSDGIVTMDENQTLTGTKTFSKVQINSRVAGASTNFLFGGYDGEIDASAGDYATIQAGDDALDAAAGYRMFVNGGQTYAETVTVSTNDNYIVIGPRTVITSLVISGNKNTVVIGASCQFTGALTLSGNNNTVIMGPAANLDENITLSGTACELHLGVASSIATTKTLLLSGANSKCIVGAEATWPGIINMTADDTYMEIGNQSVITGVTSLQTGTGQVMRCGNETQLIGNITLSSADAELHMGSAANIDGTVTQSGARSILKIGSASDFAQTLAVTGINASVELGPSATVAGNITVGAAGISFSTGSGWDFNGTIVTTSGDEMKMTLGSNGNLAGVLTIGAPRSEIYVGADSTLSSAVSMDANGDQSRLATGPKVAFSSTLEIDAGADSGSTISLGPNNQVTGAIDIDGDDGCLRVGASSDLGGIVTLDGVGCSLICENGCDLDGIIISGAKGLVDGGGHNTLVDGTTANHAINISATDSDDAIIRNISVQTTAAGGGEYDGIVVADGANRVTIENVVVNESDDFGIDIFSDDVSVINCNFMGTHDDDMLNIRGDRARVIGNHFGTGAVAHMIKSTGEKTIIIGNCGEDTAQTFVLGTDADHSLVVGNITDVTIIDGSSSSTVASNEEY